MLWIEQAKDLFQIDLSQTQAAQFEHYLAALTAWNTHTNLTAIIEPNDVRVRHFLDSLSLVKVTGFAHLLAAPTPHIIDVGTGAGFPGLALAIAFPALQVTLLEATGKKVQFLQHVIDTLALPNAHTYHARAEEAGQSVKHRAHYDWVVARAVARLPGLVEYLLPLAKVGGLCIAMKGTTAQAEADDSRKALAVLGGRVRGIERIHLPNVNDEHALIIMEKTKATPATYPRKPGIPTRKPLE
jgi:16S rRNA (guanine527-N7)-methyltransferase